MPWFHKALTVRPGAHVLAYDMDNNLYSSDALIVVTERVAQDPAMVKALLRALLEADHNIAKNRKGAEQILSKELSIKPDEIGAQLDTVEQYLALDDIMVKHLCQSAKFLISNSQIARGTGLVGSHSGPIPPRGSSGACDVQEAA